MPNLKEQIVKRLTDFPSTVVEGKPFSEYIDDLAEDIQADVIKSLQETGALALLGKPEEADSALEYQLDQLANDFFGAILHNMVFMERQRTDINTAVVTRAMLRAFLLATQ